MAFFAWRGHKRRELLTWVIAIAMFTVAFSAHAVLVHTQTGSADPTSQGWLRFGGWPFVLDLVRRCSFLVFVPGWVAAVVIPLALLGWSSRRTPFADRVTVTVVAYIAAFMIIGRPENLFWGVMFVLLLIPGLAFAPSAITQLAGRRRLRSTTPTTSAWVRPRRPLGRGL